MFVGTNKHSVDAKGRVIVPAKYRGELGREFYIIRDFTGGNCLSVYPRDAWEELVGKLKKFPKSNLNAQRFVRSIVAGAETGEIDSQGRMLLKADLKEKTGIKKDVAIVGNIDHFDIWDVEKWEEFDGESHEMLDDNPDFLATLAELDF